MSRVDQAQTVSLQVSFGRAAPTGRGCRFRSAAKPALQIMGYNLSGREGYELGDKAAHH